MLDILLHLADVETEVDDEVASAVIFLELWHLELGRPGDTREEAKVLTLP